MLGHVFSIYPFLLWWLREYKIIIKPEVWTITHWNNGMCCMFLDILIKYFSYIIHITKTENIHQLRLDAINFQLLYGDILVTLCNVESSYKYMQDNPLYSTYSWLNYPGGISYLMGDGRRMSRFNMYSVHILVIHVVLGDNAMHWSMSIILG